jgi:hypothetical protein
VLFNFASTEVAILCYVVLCCVFFRHSNTLFPLLHHLSNLMESLLHCAKILKDSFLFLSLKH